MDFPPEILAFQQRPPHEIQELIEELNTRPLTTDTIDQWLKDWRNLAILFQETLARLDIATDLNTQDQTLTRKRDEFRQTFFPLDMQLHQQQNQRLKAHEHLLPPIFKVTLEDKVANRRLDEVMSRLVDELNEEAHLAGEYNAIRGAQTVELDGETLTMSSMRAYQHHTDRATRERMWKLAENRKRADTEQIDAVWKKLLNLRVEIARKAGYENYIDYRFAEMQRQDYTPSDLRYLHDLFSEIVVPGASQAFQLKQNAHHLDSLRPWDINAPLTDDTVKAFSSVSELLEKSSRIFHRIDAEFGDVFDKMVKDGLIDLDDRPNKGAAGGFTRAVGDKGSFLFMKVTGSHRDVENMMHEMGHAFAMNQVFKLPYLQVMFPPTDFSETPSMAMEFLSMPFWDEFYPPETLKRVQLETLYQALYLWCDYPLFDAFQHWAYTHPQKALDPAHCDRKWGELAQQFHPFVDWSGLETGRNSGWRDNMLIFMMPLMGMEYAFGQLVAIHLWEETQRNLPEAIQRYKKAIGLGRTVTLAELFQTLDTAFPIQREDLQNATSYIVNKISQLQAELSH